MNRKMCDRSNLLQGSGMTGGYNSAAGEKEDSVRLMYRGEPDMAERRRDGKKQQKCPDKWTSDRQQEGKTDKGDYYCRRYDGKCV